MSTVEPSDPGTGKAEHSGDPSAQPRTPFEAAARVVRTIQLTGVRFQAFSARAVVHPAAIPEGVSLAATTKFLRPTIARSEGGFSSRTTLVFQVSGSSAPEDHKPFGTIQATLEAEYA